MKTFLGIDSSNYRASAAVLKEDFSVSNERSLLPVENGKLGLRQSDAVFQQVKLLPSVIEKAFFNQNSTLTAVGASERPRDVADSYMPCFLVGSGIAKSIAASHGVNYYGFSHQAGHIAAALYSANRLDLLEKKFIAFHVSGGTTEALLVEPDEDTIFRVTILSQTLDLNAGQVIDRVGVMLGLPFPAGKELDLLSSQCSKTFPIKPSLKENDCCLSGVQNICETMFHKGEQPSAIASYAVQYLYKTLDSITKRLLAQYGEIPLVFAGGVMANSFIKEKLSQKYGAYFAKEEFSGDNAVGISVLAAKKAGEL